MKDVLQEMKRLNVTAAVFGDPKSVRNGVMPRMKDFLLAMLQWTNTSPWPSSLTFRLRSTWEQEVPFDRSGDPRATS